MIAFRLYGCFKPRVDAPDHNGRTLQVKDVLARIPHRAMPNCHSFSGDYPVIAHSRATTQ
jgi:hypothetical protein